MYTWTLLAAVAGGSSPQSSAIRRSLETSSLVTQEPRQDLRHPDTRDYAEGRGTYNAPEVVVVEKPQAQPAGGID
jgi:hypothetical protein